MQSTPAMVSLIFFSRQHFGTEGTIRYFSCCYQWSFLLLDQSQLSGQMDVKTAPLLSVNSSSRTIKSRADGFYLWLLR